MAIYKTALIMLSAFILDCIIGDPQNPFHPMRLIGSGISLGEKAYKKTKAKKPAVKFTMGALLALATVALSYAATKIITQGFYHIDLRLGMAAEAAICYFLIAPKALRRESMKVYGSLRAGDLDEARKNLSYIVGRDVQNLDAPEIIKAAVETIAENLNDGTIAPLVFICIGGAPLGMAYKAINTLDSMLGYRTGDYEHFGKFAARLDDAANLIPARFSAVMMILGSLFIGAGGSAKNAARIFARDRYNHKSPNSAQTESVCAGALGLKLGGDAYYHGALVSKQTIGDEINRPEPEHIKAANRLMYAATIAAIVLLAAGSVLFAISRGSANV